MPQTIGSTTGGMVLYCAVEMGQSPACLLFSKPIDSLAAAGAILAGVWSDIPMITAVAPSMTAKCMAKARQITTMLPLAVPVSVTVGLFSGLAYWNDWINALYYIESPKLYGIQNLLIRMQDVPTDPPDCPATVILSGSPPKVDTFSRNHSKASRISSNA